MCFRSPRVAVKTTARLRHIPGGHDCPLTGPMHVVQGVHHHLGSGTPALPLTGAADQSASQGSYDSKEVAAGSHPVQSKGDTLFQSARSSVSRVVTSSDGAGDAGAQLGRTNVRIITWEGRFASEDLAFTRR